MRAQETVTANQLALATLRAELAGRVLSAYWTAVGAQKLVKALADSRGAAGDPDAARTGEALSPREAETLRLIARGLSNKEIARRIDVSVKSIETYKARAAEKLGVKIDYPPQYARSRADAWPGAAIARPK